MPKKNRIVIFGWANSTHLQRWVEGLSKRDWQIKVVSSGGESLPNVETVVLPHSGSVGYVQYAGKAADEAKKFQPHLLHVHYAFGFGWWGTRANMQPMITTLWGSDVTALSASMLTRWFGRRLFRKSVAVTATSEYLKQRTLKYWPEIDSKLSRIPFGVDIPETPSVLPPFPVRLAFAKMHLPTYGPDILLQAIKILADRGVTVHLTIAGAGELTGQMQEMTQTFGLSESVRFIGWLDRKKMPDLLKEHHIVVMPSRMESFGVSALEAASVGRPVIASNVGGIPEVVQHNKTGILVPPENPTALADAIERLVKNPDEMERMGKAGYEMVKQQYNWERSLDMMSELYERVIHAAQ